MPALSVVVPTYNERERLPELVESLVGAFHGAGLDGEVVIVDDNSPDGTGAIADALSEGRPVKVLHRSGKLGLGTAVVDGFSIASAPILGVIDADLSHPPAMLPVMYRVLGATGSDMVIASRYVEGGGAVGWPLSRLLMSRFACALARGLTPVRDATSGFFLVRREAISGVRIEAGGFKICLELLVRGRVGSVVEVPYEFADRAAGQSKMSLKEAVGYFWQLRDLYLVHLARRGRRPAYRRITASEAWQGAPATDGPPWGPAQEGLRTSTRRRR
ncbi:MAG: polyprenol monophosphomannose synthase [Vicinamibacterales bacterium]